MKILHLEDNPSDGELILSLLTGEGLTSQVIRVQSRQAFEEALEKEDMDLILADYSLPSYDGLSALSSACQRRPEVPFIFVSGTIGEEVAINAIQKGATDYVLKQRLSRLGPAVRRALKEVEERHERKKLEMMVLQSEKMASMGQLAASVAHELNNPLTAIMGYAQILRDGQGLSEQQKKDVSSIESQSHRCAEIVQNLLQFSRQKVPKKENLHMGSVLESTLQLVQHDLMISGIDIRKDISNSLPTIYGDNSQLQQVFLNLMINAKHAMEGRRPASLVIQTQLEKKDVLIHIKDSGCGIPKENLDKIFDIFFTTKPSGKGTGLGLSIVSSIVKDHEGVVEVQSQVGIGTDFTVRLPVHAGT